jgi:EAL domain-containing protein (putative c-di-GMP-specific phosphodiesterase class I)
MKTASERRAVLLRRPVWSWALVDWANSAFATTVMAGFFPVFFKQYWSVGVEVTESTFIGDGEAARSMLLGLRRLGITVALDDFGTGFSSLAYLQALPIDVLKVDRSFVQGLEGGGASARIVDTVVRLAHGLGVRVVAEGVESQAQLEALRKLGCDTAQGYLLARPQPPQAITSLLLGIRATKTLAIPA